jgi:hypothetical protein
MFALSPDLGWSDKIVNDAKRYIYFPPGAYHPATLHNGDENVLNDGQEYYFARKLDASQETTLAQWIDDRRDSIDTELGITESDDSEESS